MLARTKACKRSPGASAVCFGHANTVLIVVPQRYIDNVVSELLRRQPVTQGFNIGIFIADERRK